MEVVKELKLLVHRLQIEMHHKNRSSIVDEAKKIENDIKTIENVVIPYFENKT